MREGEFAFANEASRVALLQLDGFYPAMMHGFDHPLGLLHRAHMIAAKLGYKPGGRGYARSRAHTVVLQPRCEKATLADRSIILSLFTLELHGEAVGFVSHALQQMSDGGVRREHNRVHAPWLKHPLKVLGYLAGVS